MRIAVVGGGILGCTAAWELIKAGHSVTLLERSAKLGGLAGSFRFSGFHLEKFYHHIFRHDHPIRKLIRALGLSESLLWNPAKMGFFTQGRLHPFSTPLDLLRFTPLSMADKFRFARSVRFLQKFETWRDLEKITARDWYAGRGAENVYRAVWRPLLRQKFGDAEPEISAAWLWGRVNPRARSRQGLKETLGYLDGGFIRIFEALEKRILDGGAAILTKTEARSFRIGRSGRVKAVLSDKGEHGCDILLWTAPIPPFLKAAPPLPEALRAGLESIPYRGVVCLTLLLDKPVGRIYWINIADPASPFGCVIEHTNFVPASRYGGATVVYVSAYLRSDDPLYGAGMEAVSDTFLNHLEKILPSFDRGCIRNRFLFREPYATPVYGRNYLETLPPMQMPVRGLFLANTAQIYPFDRNMSNSVKVALDAVDCILKKTGN